MTPKVWSVAMIITGLVGLQTLVTPTHGTPCREERARAQASNRLGTFLPECHPDGTYAAKQCQGSRCYCADEGGATIGTYSDDRWNAEDLHCKCAREELEITNSGVIGRWISCDPRGNYQWVQCTGSRCYCVETLTGERQSANPDDVGIWESDTLICN